MKRAMVFIVAILFLSAALPPGEVTSGPCGNSYTPPFIATGTKPNILILFDNSNSLDEDFFGNAVTSYSSASKSVIAKKALRDQLVADLKDKARVGVMTFNLPAASAYSIYNMPYFSSYNPNNFCDGSTASQAALDACVNYCITGDATAKSTCEAACPGVTAGADFPDEIIKKPASGGPAWNSEKRKRYCPLIYPKTQRRANPTDAGRYIYFKEAHPLYVGGVYNAASFYFGYVSSYNTADDAANTYDFYRSKTGIGDDFTGYTQYSHSWGFVPTDTDFALGYHNFGRRAGFYYVGQAYESDSAPPSAVHGYLKVASADLSDTTQYTNVKNALDPKENDASGYMSCAAGNKNTCSYIVNAGLTPTAGALQTALNYFKGTYSGAGTPIADKCQKNYILFITDGLPSVKLNGAIQADPTQISTLMPEVITQLAALQTGVTKTFSGKSYSFPIKTYVLGLGLNDYAKTNIDSMAVTGGTAKPDGHAYYADNAAELTDALNTITADLLGRVASGSSISILSEGQTQMGNNMMQGVFYPNKYFAAAPMGWPGFLYDYWFYNSKTLNNIREDTIHDYLLDLDEDYGISFAFDNQAGLQINRYADPTGSGDPSQFVDKVDLDGISPIWEAGRLLFGTAAAGRKIYTPNSAGTLVNFDTVNAALTTPATSLLGNPSVAGNLDTCLKGATDTATLQNLINYVRGVDVTGVTGVSCRSRTVGLCSNGTDFNNEPCSINGDCTHAPFSTCAKNVWKLGDIVYSTPKVQTDYRYCFNGTDYTTQSCSTDGDCPATSPTCQKKENIVFVGANDGMLHAFKTGIETEQGLNANEHEIGKLTGIPTSDMGKELWAFIPKNALPYLRCLAVPPPSACHLYFNDLSPYITRMNVGGVTKTILIGGMRLGGGSYVSGSYCFNNANPAVSNSQTCSNKNDCAAPYNNSCQAAYHFTPPADTFTPQTSTTLNTWCADPNTCYNPAAGVGLSSYYAIDITDVEAPKLLWEFSHPFMGYSYSGPAVIHKWTDPATKTGDRYYVMFLSGPTNPVDGSSIQNLKSFVLSLNDQLGISSLFVNDFGNPTKNGFGGRLFTSGVDVNGDGYTDFVFFGYGYSASGNTGDWKGGIAKVNTNNANATLALSPQNWTYDVTTYSNIAQLPLTAKVETMKCFNTWYLYAGTGRYFFPLDNYGPAGNSGRNFIIGVPFTCDQFNQNCGANINSLNDNKVACDNLQKGAAFLDQAGWQYQLNDAEDVYEKERVVTDPSVTNSNKIFFVSSEPTADPCGYAGRTRVWGLNCATGAAISDNSCAGYTVTDTTGTLYLQVSTGAINKIDAASSFTGAETANRTTQWAQGIPPENAPPVVNPVLPATLPTGAIIQWIEK